MSNVLADLFRVSFSYLFMVESFNRTYLGSPTPAGNGNHDSRYDRRKRAVQIHRFNPLASDTTTDLANPLTRQVFDNNLL